MNELNYLGDFYQLWSSHQLVDRNCDYFFVDDRYNFFSLQEDLFYILFVMILYD